MKLENTLILMLVLFFTALLPVAGYSQSFQSHGYNVDMRWKVKGRYLRAYGVIEEGRPCWKLKVKADMGNKIHSLSAGLVTYTGKHNPYRRTVFNAKSDLGRNYKATKGWYVEKLSVYCVGKK